MRELTPWLLMAALTVTWMLDRAPATPPAEARPPAVFDVATLLDEMHAEGQRWHAFLDVPTLRTGLYVLPEAAEDRQQPHTEDEVYYVLDGAAQLTVESETFGVRAGQALFVPAHAPHQFHDVSTDLRLLVFFSKALPPSAD